MSPEPAPRILALDRMRGLVMVLMTIDHASQFWNAGRVATDSAYLGRPSADPVPAAQFWTRFVTHLCAPSFLFLVGAALALSLAKRAQRLPAWRVDRHLATRALVILGCEALLSTAAGEGVWILQVLFAISMAMLAMIALRRLPPPVVLGLGLLWVLAGEAVTTALYPVPESLPESLSGPRVDPLGLALFVPAYAAPVTSLYPALHWVALAAVGWGFGSWLLEAPGARRIARRCAALAAGCALAFVAVRALNAYGNMGLTRARGDLQAWLELSKYPPSLSYVTSQGALLFAWLALFFWRDAEAEHTSAAPRGPLVVFGQTALFFYMAHFFVLAGSALALGYPWRSAGLLETYAAALFCLVFLYPLCLLYRRAKRRWPRSPLQYL